MASRSIDSIGKSRKNTTEIIQKVRRQIVD
jgi:hypothetical protein